MKKLVLVIFLLLLASFLSEGAAAADITDICKFAGQSSASCIACVSKGSAWTAIGCIPATPSGFISKFLTLGVSLGGGVSFLLILFSGFQMMTSTGNPEKLAAGRELMGASVSGLLLITLSLFLLKLIGFNILGIPGFK